ncbi:MAG: ABC transporter ATP-binding protein [Coriobacteriaceae bacterium]|nr:ABC transporter ATP-binding protein [Coriobacteriaceae bacterium]
MTSSAIEIRNLGVVYKDRGAPFRALDKVSFTVRPGEFVSVIGASGCGKSTLLSVLEGLLAPTEGEVLIGGKPISGPGRDRSVVFQQYSLFPWMTARANVAFALEQAKKGLKRRECLELADKMLARVGLEGFGRRFPKELSGGQQQRVAIARALVVDAPILLMDEPFGAIDAKNRCLLQELLLELWEGEPDCERKTVVFITHDLEEVILLSDRILMLRPNPGHVHAEFQVPFERPRHRLELLRNPEYQQFVSDLSDIFFELDYQEVPANG